MDQKSKNINRQLINIKHDLKNIEDKISGTLSKIKDSIIEALKEENLKLQENVESLENRIPELETDSNKQDQYHKRNIIQKFIGFLIMYQITNQREK